MSTKKANLILTTCSMAWGTSYIFMKLGIEGLSPLMLMALRTGIAFLMIHPQHHRCACSGHSCS